MFSLFQRPRFFAKKIAEDEQGATVIEFAILGPVFFAMLFSIFEMGYLFTKIAMVNHAVSVTSKNIYIGAASSGAITYEELEQQICDNIVISGDNCTDNLVLELTEISSITDLPNTDAQCEYTNLVVKPTVSFDPGSSGSTVFMRACFVTPITTPGIGFGLKLPKTDGDKFSIVASTAFVNEPF